MKLRSVIAHFIIMDSDVLYLDCTWRITFISLGFAMIDTDLGIGDVLGFSLELGTLSHCHLISKRK